MIDKYDIVVIGSGIGGLVSAALLSKLGKKILILEKEPKPGGYLTEFKADDFTFDVSLHLLNGCTENCFPYNIFKRCGIINDVKFLKPKYLYRSIFPDYDVRIPQDDLKAYEAMLCGYFPASKSGIRSLFAEMSEIFKKANAQAQGEAPGVTLLPYITHTYDDILNKHLKEAKLKAILSQLWIYFGLPPSMLRAVDFCYPWFDYSYNGGYYVEKGSHNIVKALVARIRENGGDFLFNKDVGRITVKDGYCQKIMFGRDEISCGTVISNIDLTKTVYELVGIDHFSKERVDRLKLIEPSISAFEIFLGLDTNLRDAYPDDYEIFVNSDYDIENQYRACLNNSAKTAPFVITINSNVNRFSAPPQKSAITIIMLSGYNYWVSKTKEEYQDKKEKVAEILINRAGKIIPEIKTGLQKKVISTPVTFERYSNNSKGAIYGYSWTRNKAGEIRPNKMNGVKNLYFASAWAKQGSGVTKVLRSADEVSARISGCAAKDELWVTKKG